MGELDACFGPSKFQSMDMGRDEIDEQETADKITAGKHGHRNIGAGYFIEHEEGVKELFLHAPDSELHLGEGGPEYQDDRQREQRDRELQRGEEIDKGFPNFIHGSVVVTFDGFQEGDEVILFCPDQFIRSLQFEKPRAAFEVN